VTKKKKMQGTIPPSSSASKWSWNDLTAHIAAVRGAVHIPSLSHLSELPAMPSQSEIRTWLAEGKVYGVDAVVATAVATSLVVILVTILLFWILGRMVSVRALFSFVLL
jgi:hypothetical protein